jgi:cell filamentation protein
VTRSRYDADEIEDPYSYRGTACLKNKLGLRDAETLQAFELEMSTVRADEPLPAGRFGPTHYCRIHRHLFQDVYRWAGRYRTIATSKGGNLFCRPQFIEREMLRLFGKVKSATFLLGSNRDAFIQSVAEFLSDLNAIHPFREGNGRSQLAFLYLLALRAGHPLEIERIKPATFLAAMIRSFDGDIEPLSEQLTALLA